MTSPDVAAVAVLVRDRDAWQALALQAIAALQAMPRGSSYVEPWLGEHDAQVAAFERGLIEQVLLAQGWNVKRCSELLGLKRSTLTNRMETLGLVNPIRQVVDEPEVAGV